MILLWEINLWNPPPWLHDQLRLRPDICDRVRELTEVVTEQRVNVLFRERLRVRRVHVILIENTHHKVLTIVVLTTVA